MLKLITTAALTIALTSPTLAEESADAYYLRNFTSVIERHRTEKPPDWYNVLIALNIVPSDERLMSVNRFVNAFPYINDEELWHVRDYWQAPYEFFKQGGDCEDFALTKFIINAELGYPLERMSILIVWSSKPPVGRHAVFSVDSAYGKLILDNKTRAIVHLQNIPYYKLLTEIRWVPSKMENKQ